MSATIRIPTPLRQYAGGAADVTVEAGDVAGALEELVDAHPGLRDHLYDDEGSLRNFVNVYLNEDDVRHLDDDETGLSDGDTITLVPSIAGGASRAPAPPGASRLFPGAGLDSGDEPLPELERDELRRYARHIIMPEVGEEGQQKLKEARVLLVGAGGLGSPLGLYLAAAGVGTLGIVDFDVVDETNLQRQVIHGTSDVGRPKLESARDRIGEVNPHVRVISHEERLTSENALEILRPYDVVVDGTDNFPTRYLVNDACVLLGKPNVYGSIFRFEGQVSVFWAEHGPCYRCLFREPPPPGLVPSCAEGGVLGVLPGIIGSLQALETVKLILGSGDPLVGRIQLFDALEMSWRELDLRKDPECPVCGDEPTVTELIDYEEFCGVPVDDEDDARAGREAGGVPHMSADDLRSRLDRGEELRIVDVREPYEWKIGNLEGEGAELIPLGEIEERMDELDRDEAIVLHCRTGARSADAARLLLRNGFERVWNLEGGIHAWSDEVDPSVPKY